MRNHGKRIGMETFHLANGLYGMSQDSKAIYEVLKPLKINFLENITGESKLKKIQKKLFFLKTGFFGPQKVDFDLLLVNSTFPIITKNRNALNLRRMHDIFPISKPEYFKLFSRLHFNRQLRVLLKLPNAHFVFPSNYSKSEFCDQFKIYESILLSVIPVGLNFDHFYSKTSKINRIVLVGTLEPRKNFEIVIKNFLELKKMGYLQKWELVIIGNPGWKMTGLLKEALNSKFDSVKILRNKNNQEKSDLLSESKIGICLSFDEGFSITPIEMALSGCTLILSDIEVHKEKFESFPGRYVDFLEASDEKSFRNQLLKHVDLWENNLHYEKILEIPVLAREVLSYYSVDNTKKKWEMLFERILNV